MSGQSRLASLITAIGADIKSLINGSMTNTGGGSEKVAAASGTSGTVTLDLSVASVFTLTPTGNVTTLTISNVPSSRAVTVGLIVTQGGTAYSIANPTGSKVMGVTVSQQVSKVCELSYTTVNGGSAWLVRGDREV